MHIADFLKTDGNKLIITNLVGMTNKLIRRENKRSGIRVSDTDVKHWQNIAEELYLAYCADKDKECERLLDPQETTYILNDIILSKDENYFVPVESRAVSTTQGVLEMMDQVRRASAPSPTETCENLEKLMALEEELATALSQLPGDEEGTVCPGLDETGLLLKAIDILDGNRDRVPFLLPYSRLRAIGIINSKLSRRELEFIEKLADIFGLKPVYIDTVARPIPGEPGVNRHFVRAYGQYNEINYIAGIIVDKKLKYGSVSIYYTDKSYENIIRGVMDSRDIPVSFSGGVRAESTDVAQLALGIIKWWNSKKDQTVLARVSDNRALAKKGRKEEDRTAFNERLDGLFSQDLSLGVNYKRLIDLLDDFTYITRDRNLVISEMKDKQELLSFVRSKLTLDEQLGIISDSIKSITTEAVELTNAVNAVYTGGDFCVDRANVFLCGLSAVQMQKNKPQSPVISDKELRQLFAGDVEEGLLKVSGSAGEEFRKALDKSLASVVTGDIYYTYSYYDTVNQRVSSPSVFYIEKLEEAGVREETAGFEGNILGADMELSGDEVVLDPSLRAGWYKLISESKAALEKEGNEAGGDAAPTGIESSDGLTDTPDIPAVLMEDTDESELSVSRHGDEGDSRDEDLRSEGNGEADDTHKPEEESRTEAAGEAQEAAASEFTSSSSAIEALIKCPLQYYYHYIRRLPKPEYTPFKGEEWLNAAEKGTFFHRVMELYCTNIFIGGKKGNAPYSVDELERDIDIATKEMLEKAAPPSQDIMDMEIEDLRKALRIYLKGSSDDDSHIVGGLHNTIDGDRRVIGCEVPFGPHYDRTCTDPYLRVQYESKDTGISFRGSIDRLDGRIDDSGCLLLYVVDYKTGSRSRLEEGVFGWTDKKDATDTTPRDKDQKIQHYIYGAAALEYAVNNKKSLEELFGGKKITGIEIGGVIYSFPFEPLETQEVDVTELMGGYLPVETDRDSEIKVVLPDTVAKLLEDTLGKLQGGDRDGCMDMISEKTRDILQREARRMSKEFFPRYRCEHCPYKGICRMKL